MPRTPEQVQADDNLTAAIAACRDAYVDEPAGIITEFVVLYASRTWDDDGEGFTAIGKLVCEPAPPLHHQLGLVEYVATEYRRLILEREGPD